MRKLLLALAATTALATQAGAAEEDRVATIVEETCALCHGEKGEASSSIYPRLAGQHQDYIIKQLKNFRDGKRQSDTMMGSQK